MKVQDPSITEQAAAPLSSQQGEAVAVHPHVTCSLLSPRT